MSTRLEQPIQVVDTSSERTTLIAERDVVICEYGAGNVRSLSGALLRLGVQPSLSGDPTRVANAEIVVVPGVGSARFAMERLCTSGLSDALQGRFKCGRPTLGICLGMQLAVTESDEDGGVACLGIVPGRCARIQQPRVPRVGWALVDPWNVAMYFAHSYAVESPACVAESDGMCAALSHGSFYGVQFHPEKSGRAGEQFLQQWLTAA